MRYARAQDILPAELLTKIQEYVDGSYLYIPRKDENRLAWGENTHSKRETAQRNRAIFQEAQSGRDPAQLAEAYFLTEKTIRRIIAQERKRAGGGGEESTE